MPTSALEVTTTWGTAVLDVTHVVGLATHRVAGGSRVEGSRGGARIRLAEDAWCVVVARRGASRARHAARIREVVRRGLDRSVRGPCVVELASGASARIVHGDLEHLVRFVEHEAVDARGGSPSAAVFGATLGASSLVHGVLVAMALAMPSTGTVDPSSLVAVSRAVPIDPTLELFEPELPPPPKEQGRKGGGSGAVPDGDATGGGAHDETDERTTSRRPRVPTHDVPRAAAPQDVGTDLVRDAGILGALSRLAVDGPTSPFSRATAGTSGERPGLEILLASDALAFGRAGGRGASCDASCVASLLAGGRGVGELATLGRGGRGLAGLGYGARAPLRPRSPVQVVPGVVACFCVTPNCRRPRTYEDAIHRVIHRHVAEVRYCYEQQLVTRPDVHGRVVADFVIGADGRVLASAIASSDLGAPAVDLCVAAAVRRWQFPEPPDGQATRVRYPFDLETTDASER